MKRNDRTKYNVCKETTDRTYEGIVFDSVLEMKFYRDVISPGIRNGSIVSYERQKPFILQPGFKKDGVTIRPIEYVADFVIRYANGREEIIDTKGCPDSVAKIKRKMFWYQYPRLVYEWYGYSKIDGGWMRYEELQKKRKLRKKLKEFIDKEKKDAKKKREQSTELD